MRKWNLALILLAFLLSGCSDPERQKIVGIWEIEKADKINRRMPDTPETADAGNEEEGFGGTMEVHFFWSGQLTTITKLPSIESVKEGRWELVESTDSTSTVSCTLQERNSSPQTTTVEIDWVDDNTIRMTPPNMAGLRIQLTFKRK